MRLIYIGNLLFSLAILLCASAFAASFDCIKASTPFEKAICSNPNISALDDRMMEAYKNARNASQNPDQLKTEQVDWIKSARTCGADAACIESSYKSRLAALGASISSSSIKPSGPQQDALTYISAHLWASKDSGGCTTPNNLLFTYSPAQGKMFVQNGKVIVAGERPVNSRQRTEYVYQNKTDKDFIYKGIVYAEGNPTVISLGASPTTIVSDLTDKVTLLSKDKISIDKSLTVIDTQKLFAQKGIGYKKEVGVEVLDRCN